ncbi:hypothetical protein KY338_07090 [Candidatus Woesearchaeota archaeon]|nr:hypothetical protein [Candidatus Woesearchaeota archaeon]MBW3005834.1 hypothetical protein [Candidatus Woesearchaeota archaeon]
MVEFNPDGSIKIPGSIAANIARKELKLKREKCILIKKEFLDFKPKKCVLHIKVSEAFEDSNFVSAIFHSLQLDTPVKLVKINEQEYDIEICSDFKRCSDCNAISRRFREYLEGNMIEEKGSCPQKEKDFYYEDYFE